MICKCCKKDKISLFSESYYSGMVCALCRDKLVPKHIPISQHEKYFFKKEFNGIYSR
jgi:hypothetical protein